MNVRPEVPNDAELKFPCPACGIECSSSSYGKTLVGFYSPPGHKHDDNCKTYGFICSCGRKFSVRPINLCPTAGCDWRGQEDCSVCGPNWLLPEVDKYGFPVRKTD